MEDEYLLDDSLLLLDTLDDARVDENLLDELLVDEDLLDEVLVDDGVWLDESLVEILLGDV